MSAIAILLVTAGSVGADIVSSTVSSGSGAEGGTVTLTVEVTVTDVAEATSVDVGLSGGGGSATPGADYTVPPSVSVPIDPETDSGSAPVTIQLHGDGIDEPSETFTVSAQGGGSAEVTIDDTNDPPTVSIATATPEVVEGDTGVQNVVFTVTLSGSQPSAPVTVTHATADGPAPAAAAGEDYAPPPATNSHTFNGTGQYQFAVAVASDTTVEADEHFTASVSVTSGSASVGGPAVVKILNDDIPPPTATLGGAVSAAEGTGADPTPFLFPVTVGPRKGNVNVTYTVTPLTAQGDDLNASPGTLVFGPSTEPTTQNIVVPVASDAVDEPDETFKVTITGCSPCGAFTPQEAGGTILDDDEPPVVGITDPAPVGEADGAQIVFTATLSAPSGQAVTVDYTMANENARAGFDYQAIQSSITFAPGETAKTISVLVHQDTVDEDDETFLVLLTGGLQARGTIVDDDPPPLLSLTDPTVGEPEAGGLAPATLTATLSTVSERVVTVDFVTVDETAAAGQDYDAAAGTLTFAPGELSKPIVVNVRSDEVSEAVETFLVALVAPVNAEISPSAGTSQVSIVDKNAPPTLSIDDTVAEEGKGAVFVVNKLGTATQQTVRVRFATANGTAQAGSDYAARVGTLTFAPSETRKVIEVTVHDDALPENEETFAVAIEDAVGATILKASGTARIAASDQAARQVGPTTPRTVTPAGPTAARAPQMSIAPRIVSVTSRGVVVFQLSCVKRTGVTCTGTAELRTNVKKKPALLGKRNFRAKPGKRIKVPVTLSKRGVTLLKKAKKGTLKVKLFVTVRYANRTVRAAPGVVTLKAPKKWAPARKATRTVNVTTRGLAAVRVSCPKTTTGRCVGTAELRTTAKKSISLGKRRFTAKPGKTVRVPVKLSKRGVALLKSAKTKTLRARVVVTSRSAKPAGGAVTLKAPKQWIPSA